MLIDIPEYSRTPLVRGYRGKDNKLIAQVSPKTGAHTIRTLIGKTFDDNAGNLDCCPLRTSRKGQDGLVRDEFTADRLEFTARLAVTRHPVNRFISGYKHKIAGLGQWKLNAPVPSFSDFISNFDSISADYSAIEDNSIFFHFAKQVDFLGYDLSQYTHIYDIDAESEEIHSLFDVVYEKVFPRLQLNSTQDLDLTITPTPLEISWIETKYADDYTLLGL